MCATCTTNHVSGSVDYTFVYPERVELTLISDSMRDAPLENDRVVYSIAPTIDVFSVTRTRACDRVAARSADTIRLDSLGRAEK